MVRSGSARARKSDLIAGLIIRLGGIGTIACVLLVAVYLALEVAPMFLPTRMEPTPAPPVEFQASPHSIGVDEYGTIGWRLLETGAVESFDLESGRLLASQQICEEPPSVIRVNEGVVFGFDDGRVQRARIDFEIDSLQDEEVTPELESLAPGAVLVVGDGVVQRAVDQFRLQRLSVSSEEPVELVEGERILLVDQAVRPSGPLIVVVTSSGRLELRDVRERRNMLTGEITTTLGGGGVDIEGWDLDDPPAFLRVTGVGDGVLLVWRDGRVQRFDARDPAAPELAETFDFTQEEGVDVTALRFLIGKSTLLAGDSTGRTRAWFPVRTRGARGADGLEWVGAHTLTEAGDTGAPVTAIATSNLQRVAAIAFANGLIDVLFVTSERLLGESRTTSGEPARLLALGASDELVLAQVEDGLNAWRLDAPHPEVTFRSIATPVWYEGYAEPEHVWQSSSGTDAFEPKFGLGPLVFGTIKATLYSMLVATPLALLAAIYTSEFMHPRSRARVKPLIEAMAGLPSVVLGFLAALVIAPAIGEYVPETIAAMGASLVILIAGAHVWQAITANKAGRARRWRLLVAPVCIALGIGAGFALGPLFEEIAFSGDFKGWADGQVGSGAGGWFILFAPLSLLLTWGLVARSGFVRSHLSQSRASAAWRQAWIFGAIVVGSLLLAAAVAIGLASLSFDPRGGVFGTYVQRNALVVGFVMGFAVIPIIYTISEEALSAVPDHLRAASLGAGATQWQTAIRVVIPTAASGLFSALMIGLGRAVGETMIVLMAAGNTPVLDWNVFNGFRTLSANIAVELPEAVKGQTHYRMLFLAALVLFAMTFVVNTLAEVVRLRFRRRAMRL